MRVYTAMTRPGTPPELVPEGFCWAALVFGPLWLARQGAWAFAALGLVLGVAVGVWAPAWCWPVLPVLYGLFGHDLRRAALALRGFTLAHVIAGRDFDTAFGRLLAARPDLAGEFAP
jgi:hypothetical protein